MPKTVIPKDLKVDKKMFDQTTKALMSLTPKKQRFVRAYLDPANKGKTLGELALIAGYNSKDTKAANSLGSQLKHDEKIQMALGQYNDLFEDTIVGIAKRWKDSETPRKAEIALNAAMFGHDKVHGKATVKIDSQSTIVRVNINLTGDGDEPPAELLNDEIIDGETV